MPGLVRALRARFALAGAVTLVALAALPHAASALTVPMGITELSRAASAVVVVHAGKPSAREVGAAVPGRHRAIFTDVPLQVTRAIAGDKRTAFTLALPGGQVGDVGYYVSDTPTLTAGGRYVLFLDGQGRVVGGEQGSVPVLGNSVPRFGMTVPQLADAVLAARAGTAVQLTSLPQQALVAQTATGATLASIASNSAGTVAVTAVTPAITSITPGGVAAGIGSTVTISGAGFGTSQGTVKFTDGNTGSATVTATTVSSWTDTQIVAAVPQGAAGGSVVVTTSLGASSSGYSYDVSFSTDGRHFFTLPVNYYINENTADTTGEGAQIQAAMATWNAVGSNFSAVYRGATSFTGDFFSGTYSSDGVNEMFFGPLPSGYLAINDYFYYPSTGEIFESDICLSSSLPNSARWTTDASAYTGAGYVVDVQSIALHELGHTVGLDDQYVNYTGAYARVMGAYVYNTNRRALTSNENSGALYLYGATLPAPGQPTVTSSSHPSSSTWYSIANANFSASAAGTVTGYSWSIDANPTTVPDLTAETASSNITVPNVAEGERWFHVRALNGTSGSTTAHYRIRTDRTAPSMTYSAPATWQNSNVTVTLAASDALSGLQAIRYSINGAAETVYTAPFTVSAEGATSVSYRAVDAAGNWSGAVTRQVLIDRTAPDLSVSGVANAATYTTAVAPTASSTDPSATITATLDGTAYPIGTPIATNGSHTLVVSATDPAGNVTPKSFTFTLTVPDAVSPVTSVSPAGGAYATPLTVTLGASDDHSGVSATYYSLDGGTSWSAYSAPLTLSEAGVRTVSYYSVDGSGNAEKPSTVAYTLAAPVAPRTPGAVGRIDGTDRWSVAANAALAAFPGWAGVTDVVIASGEDRAAADPLAAAGLAGAYKAPVLLVSSKLTGGKVPGATEAALASIRAANGGRVTIHVVGGTTSIPATVYKRLSALRGGGGIERISGSDRYGLSVALANRVVAVVGAANVPGVLIANGEQASAFYDALAASPISYATHRPLLIVRAGSVPGAVAGALATTFAGKPRVAVNSTALLTAGAAAGAGAAERMASSADRYTAATEIADFAVSRGWLGTKVAGVANRLPDALTGGSALGRLGGPVLYTPASPLAAQTSSWLRANLPGTVLVAGGSTSVADSTLQSVLVAVQ